MVTYVENFEASNIKYTDKRSPLLTRRQSLVTDRDEVPEETIKETLGQGTNGVITLVDVHALRHKLVADLNLGFGDVLVEVHSVHAQQSTESLAHLWKSTLHSIYSLKVKF